MGTEIIEQPQLSYLIELIDALGSAANNFVLIGAHAMHFYISEARRTKDFDFVLDADSLKIADEKIADILEKLQYSVIPEARNFQFSKEIPESVQIMRIEFLASAKDRKSKDFRVEIQPNLHAHSCIGSEIVLRESDIKEIRGTLPNGQSINVTIRVARLHALAMLKFLATDDKYSYQKDPKITEEKRTEAQTHATDIVSIIRMGIRKFEFVKSFWSQFGRDEDLKKRVFDIVSKYYADINAPGIQLYREFMQIQGKGIDEAEERRALREIRLLILRKN